MNDPAFVGPDGASLAFKVEISDADETLAVILETDKWPGYTGRQSRRFVALVELKHAGRHSLNLSIDKFVTIEGEVLENYSFVKSLILTPGQKEWPDKVVRSWQGRVPTFDDFRWVGGEFAPRPRPYLRLDACCVF